MFLEKSSGFPEKLGAPRMGDAMSDASLARGADYEAPILDRLRDDIAFLAGPYRSHDSREAWLGRAARAAKVTSRQVKALWYGENADPKWSLVSALRAA